MEFSYFLIFQIYLNILLNHTLSCNSKIIFLLSFGSHFRRSMCIIFVALFDKVMFFIGTQISSIWNWIESSVLISVSN